MRKLGLLDLTDEEFAQKFLEILSKPKDSIVTELLSNGLDKDTPEGV